jgi:hypothetical protein
MTPSSCEIRSSSIASWSNATLWGPFLNARNFVHKLSTNVIYYILRSISSMAMYIYKDVYGRSRHCAARLQRSQVHSGFLNHEWKLQRGGVKANAFTQNLRNAKGKPELEPLWCFSLPHAVSVNTTSFWHIYIRGNDDSGSIEMLLHRGRKGQSQNNPMTQDILTTE